MNRDAVVSPEVLPEHGAGQIQHYRLTDERNNTKENSRKALT